MKTFSSVILTISLLGTALVRMAHAAPGDIGVFTSETRTFSTASYWIEGQDSVVLIDAQFLPNEALKAVALAQSRTGKKVSVAIVLHPNPDKFNGTAVLQERGIKVLTSAQVAQLIPAVHDIRWGWFGKEFAPEYPRLAAKPDVFGASTVNLTLAGLPITLHVLGKGASGAHVVAQYQKQVFVGDLINPTNHAWLELGTIGDWLERLNELKSLKAERIHPGRGASGGQDLIERQQAYLVRVRNLVRERLNADSLSWWAKWRLQSTIEGEYPTLGYPGFMRDGLEAVWLNEKQIKR